MPASAVSSRNQGGTWGIDGPSDAALLGGETEDRQPAREQKYTKRKTVPHAAVQRTLPLSILRMGMTHIARCRSLIEAGHRTARPGIQRQARGAYVSLPAAMRSARTYMLRGPSGKDSVWSQTGLGTLDSCLRIAQSAECLPSACISWHGPAEAEAGVAIWVRRLSSPPPSPSTLYTLLPRCWLLP